MRTISKGLYVLAVLYLTTGLAFAGKINLPETGQTTSYATGDDGDLKKGMAWPDPRFTVQGRPRRLRSWFQGRAAWGRR